VDFGDFAGEAGRAFAEDGFRVRDGFRDTVGGLVEDKSAVFEAEAFEGAMAFASAGGKKTHEEKFFVGKAGCRECGEESGRARDGYYRDLMARAECDEAIARIADQGHACIADEGNFGALLHGDDELGSAGHFVVLVIADEWLRDFVMREEFLRVAGVFASDLVGFFEDAEGAKCDVLEVTDGCADKVEAAERDGRRDLHGGSVARRKRAEGAWYTQEFASLREERAVPLYEYECQKCGRRTEKIEPVAGPHLKKCPYCGGKVERAITAPAIQFKGSGWYVTDYAGKSPTKDSAAEKGDGEKSEKKDAGTKDGGAKEGAGKETKESKDSGDKKAAKKK